jgi:hypothetical protein
MAADFVRLKVIHKPVKIFLLSFLIHGKKGKQKKENEK